jgi:hypothetical protein
MGPAREAIALVRGDVTASVCSRNRFFRAGMCARLWSCTAWHPIHLSLYL